MTSSVTRVAERLESFSNGDRGISFKDFEPILGENTTIGELNQTFQVALKQLAYWDADYLFSQIRSPNYVSMEEANNWQRYCNVSADVIVKHVPNIQGKLEALETQTKLSQLLKFSLDFHQSRPFLHQTALVQCRISFLFNKIGFKNIARSLYTRGLFPKGTVGRTEFYDNGDCMKRLSAIGREIETEFTMQRAALSVYLDRDNTDYLRVVDGVSTDLVAPDKWTPNERVEKASTVLNIISVVRKKIVQEQLLGSHNKIHQKLLEFERMLLSVDPSRQNFTRQNFTKKFYEWFRITKELYEIRTRALSGISKSIDLDELIPKLIIKNNGDISFNIPSHEFIEKLATMQSLITSASDEEDKISYKREPISESLFGKKDEYINKKPAQN